MDNRRALDLFLLDKPGGYMRFIFSYFSIVFKTLQPQILRNKLEKVWWILPSPRGYITNEWANSLLNWIYGYVQWIYEHKCLMVGKIQGLFVL